MRWFALVALLLLGAVVPARAFADVASPQDASGTVVVEIGGVGTDDTPGYPWSRVEQYLGADVLVRRYQYSTCDDISANVQALTGYIQNLRPSHVVLAGHSMGGILALTAIDSNALTDLVQAVVLVDSPVNGLSPKLVHFGESIGVIPSCLALHQMQDPAWADFSSTAVQRALASGIRVLNVTNAYDNMVPLAAQQLPEQVNVRFDVTSGTGLFNHLAVFASPAALSAIAHFILNV